MKQDNIKKIAKIAGKAKHSEKGEGRVRVFNFKNWHKFSAAFVSIAIIGIVVFFQFASENARAPRLLR